MTVSDVVSACGAGGACGGCVETVEELIHSEAHQRRAGAASEAKAILPRS
jgi:bacterioferritin-associated ferredoxin